MKNFELHQSAKLTFVLSSFVFLVGLQLVTPYLAYANKEITYESTVKISTFRISAADFEYGKNELRQMLKDRPQMSELVKEGDTIWTLAAKYFGGEVTGERIKWNPKEYHSLRSIALHIWKDRIVEIHINSHSKDGVLLSAEQSWACFFFEVFNSSWRDQRLELRNKVVAGNCSKEEFVTNYALFEYNAGLQTCCFFKRIWKKEIQDKKGVPCNPTVWFVDLARIKFEDWLTYLKNKNGESGYPFGEYGRRYDRIVLQSKVKKERTE